MGYQAGSVDQHPTAGAALARKWPQTTLGRNAVASDHLPASLRQPKGLDLGLGTVHRAPDGGPSL
jgi:hypothetical protein